MENKVIWERVKKIFFVGIKGVGMMPLALIAKEYGYEVGGSDLPEEFITDEVLRQLNVTVFDDFDKKTLANFFKGYGVDECLVITTGAHAGYNNPQVIHAKELGIVYLNLGQALGLFMSGKPFGKKIYGITITGSHGKTTTSAMAASSLSILGLKPSYSVGTSRIFPVGPSGHYGAGDLFIAEGDEYVGEPVYDKTPKILYQHPKYAIINNIDFDHPDIFKDINDLKNVMVDFVNGMDKDSVVIINNDDKNLRDIKGKFRKDIIVKTYGSNRAEYIISNIKENKGEILFSVENKEKIIDYNLLVPGCHNAMNAMGVIVLMDVLGVEDDMKRDVLSKYKGSRRRMEKIGQTKNGAIVVDDYGHHPVEIKSTLNALEKFYKKKIICVFQSHTFSRTKEFLSVFPDAFKIVDELVLIPIFKSQRDTEMDQITSKEFEKPFIDSGKKVYSAKSISDAVLYLRESGFDNEYLIVTIGAGDVYKVGYEIIL